MWPSEGRHLGIQSGGPQEKSIPGDFTQSKRGFASPKHGRSNAGLTFGEGGGDRLFPRVCFFYVKSYQKGGVHPQFVRCDIRRKHTSPT